MGNKRRTFIKKLTASVAFLAANLGAYKPKQLNYFRFGYNQTNYLRPPGAIEEDKFVRSCIYCGNCMESCGYGCIRFFKGSLEGQVVPHTPYIIAAEKACILCLRCTKTCPTGSLRPINDPKDVNIGKASINENLCLPYINQGGCGACYTVCPMRAVTLEMQRYPKVTRETCVGCGKCEEVCPQKVKAIRVFKE